MFVLKNVYVSGRYGFIVGFVVIQSHVGQTLKALLLFDLLEKWLWLGCLGWTYEMEM